MTILFHKHHCSASHWLNLRRHDGTSPSNHKNTLYPPPLPPAGEGGGEAAEGDPLVKGGPLASGLTSDGIPLTAALRHPVVPDLCKASLSAFIEILMRGCRCATERDFILSPRGEDARIYFLGNDYRTPRSGLEIAPVLEGIFVDTDSRFLMDDIWS